MTGEDQEVFKPLLCPIKSLLHLAEFLPKAFVFQFMKNAAYLNLDARMANAYLTLCAVMGTETAWTARMKRAVLLPGPSSAPRGR